MDLGVMRYSLKPRCSGLRLGLGIVTRLRNGLYGVRIPTGAKGSSPKPPDTLSGVRPVSCSVGTAGSFPGGKSVGA